MAIVLVCYVCFLFFKQKTAYEMRISDWSSDVCSSDLLADRAVAGAEGERPHGAALGLRPGPHPAPGGALREADGLSRRAELAGRVAPGHQGRDLASPAAQRIQAAGSVRPVDAEIHHLEQGGLGRPDRKSTRLNSSH